MELSMANTTALSLSASWLKMGIKHLFDKKVDEKASQDGNQLASPSIIKNGKGLNDQPRLCNNLFNLIRIRMSHLRNSESIVVKKIPKKSTRMVSCERRIFVRIEKLRNRVETYFPILSAF